MGTQKLPRSLILLCKSWGPPQGSGTSAEHTLCSTHSPGLRKGTTELSSWVTSSRPRRSQNPAGAQGTAWEINRAWPSCQPRLATVVDRACPVFQDQEASLTALRAFRPKGRKRSEALGSDSGRQHLLWTSGFTRCILWAGLPGF